MAQFKVGDRVCVLPTPATASHAGRVGAVVWVTHASGGAALAYRVKLDGNQAGVLGKNRIICRPDELEPEAGDPP